MRTPSPAASTMALVGLTDILGFSATPRCWIHKHTTGFVSHTAMVEALTARRDGYATPCGALALRDLRRALGRPFFPVAGLEEIDADLVAIDPGQLAAAIGKAGGGQQQEELLELQALDGTFDAELRAGFRDVFHHALSAPSAVDTHHMRGDATFEYDALAFALFCRHSRAPAPQQ